MLHNFTRGGGPPLCLQNKDEHKEFCTFLCNPTYRYFCNVDDLLIFYICIVQSSTNIAQHQNKEVTHQRGIDFRINIFI